MAKKSNSQCPVTGAGPVVVACDPGKHKLAFAGVDLYGTDWKWNTQEKWRWHDVYTLLKAWHVPGSVFACEDQYLHRNAKVFATLSAVRGGVEAIAEVIGYKVAPAIHPSKWQSHHNLLQGQPKRARIKERSMAEACVLMGRPVNDIDLADAVCMAAYLKEAQNEDRS